MRLHCAMTAVTANSVFGVQALWCPRQLASRSQCGKHLTAPTTCKCDTMNAHSW